MLYHVSPTPGLKTLRPRVSTHKKPYVYAIENRETALLFGAKQDDFDFIISTLPDGRPCVCECRPNVFQEVYQGKSCSVYEVSETGFLRGITGWEPELVCGGEVPVLRETAVPDLYQTLLAAEKENALVLERYTFSDAYRRKIASHIVDRLLRFEIDLDAILQTDNRFSLHYKALVLGLRALMDGHLLP